MRQHMAIDQYGQTYHGLGPHPRKEVLRRLGRKHAERMFVDDKAGRSHHIGYIISGLWLEVYQVRPFREEPHD